MKLIIAGSRTITDPHYLHRAYFTSPFRATEIVCGGASGVDHLGEVFAKEQRIPVRYFPADWSTHGKRAGPVRNQQMAEYADALLAIWDGESRGTRDMIARAIQRKLGIYILFVSDWTTCSISYDKISAGSVLHSGLPPEQRQHL